MKKKEKPHACIQFYSSTDHLASPTTIASRNRIAYSIIIKRKWYTTVVTNGFNRIRFFSSFEPIKKKTNKYKNKTKKKRYWFFSIPRRCTSPADDFLGNRSRPTAARHTFLCELKKKKIRQINVYKTRKERQTRIMNFNRLHGNQYVIVNTRVQLALHKRV